MHRLRVALVMVALIAFGAAVSAGCAPEPQPGGGGTTSTVPAPGLNVREDGTALAAGWVDETDIEGGFWILRDAPPDGSAEASTVVVLLPGKVPVSRFEELRGRYALAQGTMVEGASVRMAGPEMTVDSIEEVGEGDMVR